MQDTRELDDRDLLFLEEQLDEQERLVPLDVMEELLRDGSPPPLNDDVDELIDFSTWFPVAAPRLVAPELPSPTVLNVLRGPLDDLDELLRDLAGNDDRRPAHGFPIHPVRVVAMRGGVKVEQPPNQFVD